MSKAADEYEDIARRLKELEADRQLALTGSTVPEQPKASKEWTDNYVYPMGWNAGSGITVFTGVATGGTGTTTLSVHQLPPYTPKQVNG